MSSSVYEALRSVGYTDSGIIDFATSLLAKICDGEEAVAQADPPLDIQTGLPTGHVLSDILEFEFARARSMCHRLLSIIVVAVDGQRRELCGAAERFNDEKIVAEALRARMRRSDAVGRTERRELVLLMPGAGSGVAESTAVDVYRDLHAGALSRGTRVEIRQVSCTRDIESATALLDAARAAEPVGSSPPKPAPVSRQRPVVLALCGGAAMAAAHAGVLYVLDELGVEVSGIGATSAGALVAAMYAMGLDRETMLSRFTSLSGSPVYARIRGAYLARRVRARRQGAAAARLGFANAHDLAAADNTMLRELIEHFVPEDRAIESMRIRLALSATDLVAGRSSFISHGSLHDGLMAACAVPGLFPPQRMGERLLVDGSLVGELPIAAATSIAGDADVVGCYIEGPTIAPRSFKSGAAVAARVAAVRQHELVCEQARGCRTVLRIPVADVGWFGFSKCADAERIGREVALRSLQADG